jgi:hypothetical protein
VIVEEDFFPAFLLDLVMLRLGAPADQCLLIVPVREGEDPSLAGEALVPDVVDEALHPLQLRPEDLGESQVGVPLLLLGMNFEQDREHDAPPLG